MKNINCSLAQAYATFELSLCLFQAFRHWDGWKRSAGAGNNSLGWRLGREGERKLFPHYNKTKKDANNTFLNSLRKDEVEAQVECTLKIWKGLGSPVIIGYYSPSTICIYPATWSFSHSCAERLGYERSWFHVQVRPWVAIFFLFDKNAFSNRSKIF